jgi:hypothetical protein
MASQTLNLRQDLTDYAFGVAQDEAKVLALANAIAPVVPTGSSLVTYATFNGDNAFQAYNARRGVGGKAQRVLFGADTGTVDLGANALEIGIDDQERERAGGAFSILEQAKVKSLVLNAYLSHAKEVVTVFQAGVAAQAGKGKWSEANVDPIDQIDEQIDAIARYGMPNRLILDIGAWRLAKNNPLVKARFAGKGFGLQDFASQLLNPSIQIELTAVGINTYGAFNASSTKKALLGSECIVMHSSDAPTPYDPSAVKTFATRAELFAGVSTYRDDATRSDIYALDWTAKPVVISALLARRITVS